MRPFARQGQVVSWPALAVLGALALVFIVLGHDGRRVWQVALLILAVFAWMRWPLQSPVWGGVRRVAAFVTVMLCVLDGSVRALHWPETDAALANNPIAIASLASPPKTSASPEASFSEIVLPPRTVPPCRATGWCAGSATRSTGRPS